MRDSGRGLTSGTSFNSVRICGSVGGTSDGVDGRGGGADDGVENVDGGGVAVVIVFINNS